MTTPISAPTPRNFAAEFAAIMAEQADLNRRAFRLLEDATRSWVLAPRADQPKGSTKLFAADGAEVTFGKEVKASTITAPITVHAQGERADVAHKSSAAGAPTDPAPNPAPTPEAPEAQSPRDAILDLYAATTLDFGKMAAQLGLTQAKVAGTVAGCRRGGDPRVIAGDAARRQANAPCVPAMQTFPKPAPPAAAQTSIPPLAPTPRSPEKREAKPAITPEPLPPVKTPAEAKARADARARVLRHYGETGDYDDQTAKKLGLLRSWVTAFIHEARETKDPRVSVGDSRRRTRERSR